MDPRFGQRWSLITDPSILRLLSLQRPTRFGCHSLKKIGGRRSIRIRDWPRARKAATGKSLSWSALEQSAANPNDAVLDALVPGNREYEEKFGRIFLLCATGRSAPEMLAILRERMRNDAVTELREAAEQQRLITLLRLRRWLQMPGLTCAELVASMSSEVA
jgi:hypothetical protein